MLTIFHLVNVLLTIFRNVGVDEFPWLQNGADLLTKFHLVNVDEIPRLQNCLNLLTKFHHVSVDENTC